MLQRNRERLEDYLAQGGTLVSFDEVNRQWLSGLDWVQHLVDISTLTVHGHPMLAGLGQEHVSWHAHGVLMPPEGATTLVAEGGEDAILFLDERTHAPGRLLAGTLDPDCHAGNGSDRTRPLLRAILRWVFLSLPQIEELQVPPGGSLQSSLR